MNIRFAVPHEIGDALFKGGGPWRVSGIWRDGRRYEMTISDDQMATVPAPGPRLRELSDDATPGPWIRRWASLLVHHMGGDDAMQKQKDIDFAVAAVDYVRGALRIERP